MTSTQQIAPPSYLLRRMLRPCQTQRRLPLVFLAFPKLRSHSAGVCIKLVCPCCRDAPDVFAASSHGASSHGDDDGSQASLDSLGEYTSGGATLQRYNHSHPHLPACFMPCITLGAVSEAEFWQLQEAEDARRRWLNPVVTEDARDFFGQVAYI